MVQLGDIIEIESSPEPNPPPHRSQSRVAILNGPKSPIKDKGKGKATPYRPNHHPNHRMGLASSVIELTDSESDSEVDDKPLSRSQTQVVPSTPSAGPSSQKWKNKPSIPNSNTLRPTGSLDTIPTPPQQNGVLVSGSGSGTASGSAIVSEAGPSKQKPTSAGAHNHNQVLFLVSDEEYEPPAPLPGTIHIERDVGVMDDPPIVIGREPTILIPIPDIQPQIPTQTNPEPPTPTPDLDPISTAVAQILEIIPNVEPTHLLELIETHLPTFSVFHDRDAGEAAAREATVKEQVQGVVGHVLHLLFENPDYPKADSGKGKGKRMVEDEDDNKGKGKGKAKDKKPKIDYASVDRPFPSSLNYFDLALYHLQTSFPQIPRPYLRRQLQIHQNLYAPTHLSILAAEKNQKRKPYTMKTIKSTRITLRKPQSDAAFEEEKAWLDAELAGGADGKGVDATINNDDEEKVVDTVMDDANDGEDDGGGIECQCCFADYPFSKMVQCPEAHLFCSTCISTYASTQLGTHNSSLTCIHSSSCPHPFPPSELKRVLPVKLYELYERLEQQKQIMQAGLVGLEECPFCEWKCVLEVSSEEDKLFRCGNEEGGCGVVSCRGCKKLDHLPKSCKEVEEDKSLDGRHAIEEAMTRALMRNCPKCQKAFIKELGCNKMSCPNCNTLSCYVCRKVIRGYDHFNQQPGRPSTSADANRCMLWDAVEERHAQEVKEAAEKAMQEYKRDHPDVDESAIKVDLPDVPIKAPVAPGVVHMPMMFPAAMAYPPMYIPIANPIVGPAHAYHHMMPPPVPPLPRRYVRHRQHQQRQQAMVANQHHQQAPYTRARAALVEEQQRQKKAANSKAERARRSEQARLAEEENRIRQRLDRAKEQGDAIRRERERFQLAMEFERQGQRDRWGQMQPQMQPQSQPQPQVQPYHHHHHVYHQHQHQQPLQQQQPPPPHLQNPFALGYARPMEQQQQQQQQQQPVMGLQPQGAEKPYFRGRGRRRR